MKTIKTVLMFTFTGLFFVACKNNDSVKTEDSVTDVQTEEAKKEILAENLQTASFTIDGMHCEFGCAKGIEKKLAKIDGIKSASIDFETKQATIEYDSTVHTPQILAEAVESMDTKYKVSDIKSSSDQSYLYFGQDQDKKKEKKAKKSKKSSENTTTDTTEKPAEKKDGCCKGKSSCSSKEKSDSL